MNTIAAQVIGTRRLDLLPLHVEHAEEMAAVLSDPALHTFIGGTPYTLQVLRSRCQRMTAGSPDPAAAHQGRRKTRTVHLSGAFVVLHRAAPAQSLSTPPGWVSHPPTVALPLIVPGRLGDTRAAAGAFPSPRGIP